MLRARSPSASSWPNSIVQDGHAMLSMLAHSRRAFLGVKAVNFMVGLMAGAAAPLGAF
jgi:hypothetical protein